MDLESEEAISDLPVTERYTVIGVAKGEGVEKKSEGTVLWCWRGEDGLDKQKITVRLGPRRLENHHPTLLSSCISQILVHEPR